MKSRSIGACAGTVVAAAPAAVACTAPDFVGGCGLALGCPGFDGCADRSSDTPVLAEAVGGAGFRTAALPAGARAAEGGVAGGVAVRAVGALGVAGASGAVADGFGSGSTGTSVSSAGSATGLGGAGLGAALRAGLGAGARDAAGAAGISKGSKSGSRGSRGSRVSRASRASRGGSGRGLSGLGAATASAGVAAAGAAPVAAALAGAGRSGSVSGSIDRSSSELVDTSIISGGRRGTRSYLCAPQKRHAPFRASAGAQPASCGGRCLRASGPSLHDHWFPILQRGGSVTLRAGSQICQQMSKCELLRGRAPQTARAG
jgi:hypothetical protein